MTAIDSDVAPLLAGLPSTSVEICAVAHLAEGEFLPAAKTLLRANPWDDEASNSAGWGARLLMVPVLVFFGVATLFGCLFRGIVGLRLRAAARQPEVSDGELCQLKQANRITSVAVLASLVGLAVIGLAYVVF